MASSYWELLKHPKWQEKRLKIMERAEFSCEDCGDKDTTLNVHHIYYKKGAKPWEYEDLELRCLCETCHKEKHNLDEDMKIVLGSLSTPDFVDVFGYALMLATVHTAEDRPAHKVDCVKWLDTAGGELVAGVCNAVGCTFHEGIEIVESATENRLDMADRTRTAVMERARTMREGGDCA